MNGGPERGSFVAPAFKPLDLTFCPNNSQGEGFAEHISGRVRVCRPSANPEAPC